MSARPDTCANDDCVQQGRLASRAEGGEDLGGIEHDGIDAGQLLDNCNEERDDQLGPVAGFEQGSEGVFDGIGLPSLQHNVLELQLHILLASDLLQDLHRHIILSDSGLTWQGDAAHMDQVSACRQQTCRRVISITNNENGPGWVEIAGIKVNKDG